MSPGLTGHGREPFNKVFVIKYPLIIRYTRLLRVAIRYAQLQAYMAWYSTLGGAHSSLGDRFGVHVSNTCRAAKLK